MPLCASERCGRPRRWWRGAGTGVTLDGQWVCSRACVEAIVRARIGEPATGKASPAAGRSLRRLGGLLVHHRACRADALAAALAAQVDSGLRLGEQLRLMGAVDDQVLLRALAEQAHVGYLVSVDVERVLDAPGGLTADAVVALGLVPLGPPDGDRVRVACSTPVPRAALTAFRAQTGWTAEPFLVGDDDWPVLQRHYGARRSATTTPCATEPVLDADDAAARVADAVLLAGEARVDAVRWDSYVWMRVSGDAATTDVIVEHVADAPHWEERSWPAATMSL